jgi:hypothetical protein
VTTGARMIGLPQANDEYDVALWPVVETQAMLSEVYWRTAWQCSPLLAAGLNVRIFFAGMIDGEPPQPAWLAAPECQHRPSIEVLGSEANRPRLPTAKRVIVWDGAAVVGTTFKKNQEVVLGDDYLDVEAPDRVLAAVTRWAGASNAYDTKADTSTAILERLKRDDLIIIGPGANVVAEYAQAVQSFPNAIKLSLATSVMVGGLFDTSPPDIVVALDAAGQLGPSSSAQAFRMALCHHMVTSKTILVTSKRNSAPFLAALPESVCGQVIVLDQLDSDTACFEDVLEAVGPRILDTGNILTALALPLASFLAKRIIFAGITLAPNIDSGAKLAGYWHHADAVARERRHGAMLMAHPLFGLDMSHLYLARHVAALDEAQRTMAARGITFFDHTGSDLPLLPAKPAFGLKKSGNSAKVIRKAYAVFRDLLDRPNLTAFVASGIIYALLQLLFLGGLEVLAHVLIASCFGLIFLALVGLTLHIRRQNARLLRLLNQQSRREFENLNLRLEALEGIEKK